MEKKIWESRLNKIATDYQFDDGYKLLYCPWSTIEASTLAFISLNPGAAPSGVQKNLVSDECGNSYVEEANNTESPLTRQFILMSQMLEYPPSRILTGVIHPFRSNSWKDFSKERKDIGLQVGVEFWSRALSQKINTIVVTGSETCQHLIKITNSKLELSIPSGWGTTQIHRYVNSHGCKVIALPHLSRYKLFSRPECQQPLTKIFNLQK